ncbi:MAG: hypothetical protein IJ849_01120 [Selenomonadaceae bacterium]|nr:hypothetical protein [Selenomonadaceae bacterium]
MRIFKESVDRKRLSIINDMPISIDIRQSSPGRVRFKNGSTSQIGCLGCINPRCMSFSEQEIECDYVSSFPCDKSIGVCPVDALSWDIVIDAPTIDICKCISCGICVSRCPIGAMYFSEQGEVHINSNTGYTEKNKIPDSSVKDIHLSQIKQLIKIPHTGILLNASDTLFERVYKKPLGIDSKYHNFIGRNLLIALGCKCSMRRIGDVYTRMDAIYLSSTGTFGAIEIEFGRDTLEAVRGILDDIAVLHTRYGIHRNNNKAMVICLQLPNERQGYWQVVKDIKSVEKIKIGTVTVGGLMFLLWNGCTLKPENDLYYLDYDNMDLRNILSKETGVAEIGLSKRKLGIMEPMK